MAAAAMKTDCPICANETTTTDIVALPCKHAMCRACWHPVLKTLIEKKYPLFSENKLPCPSAPACKGFIPTEFVLANCSPDTLAHIKNAQSTIPDPNKPIEALTMDDFNYYYDANGMLKHKITQGKFIFINQAHYELLGDFVTIHIQRLMRDKYGLTELFLPFESKTTTAANFLPTTGLSAADAKAATAAAGGGATAASGTAAAAQPIASAVGGVAAAAAAGGDAKDGKSSSSSAAAAGGAGTAAGSATAAKPPALVNNIFASKNALYCDTLLVLIQGSGAVRAGQWARACCINDSLSIGSIFPYLERAAELGWGVVVLNPNLTKIKRTPQQLAEWKVAHAAERAAIKQKTGREPPAEDEKSWNYQMASQWIPIPENETPRAHTLYCWDRVINVSKAKDIVAVAHSAGGSCTLDLLQRRTKDVIPRLRAVAFTDSVHSVPEEATKPVRQFMLKHCINYVTSDEPLDTPVQERDSPEDGCPCVSAGHTKHEFTSGTAFPSVFKFLAKHIPKAKK